MLPATKVTTLYLTERDGIDTRVCEPADGAEREGREPRRSRRVHAGDGRERGDWEGMDLPREEVG